MCDIGDERAAVWDCRRVVARKPHRCVACRCVIAVGVTHDRIGCLYDGNWSTLRVHVDCHALARKIGLEVCNEHTYTIEDLRSEVCDHYPEAPELLGDWRRILRARVAEGVWP